MLLASLEARRLVFNASHASEQIPLFFLVHAHLLKNRNGVGCRKQESIIGYDHTTLRRHMAAKHKVCGLLSYQTFVLTRFTELGPLSTLVPKK